MSEAGGQVTLAFLLQKQTDIDKWFEKPLMEEAKKLHPIEPNSSSVDYVRQQSKSRLYYVLWRRVKALADEAQETLNELPFSKWWKGIAPNEEKIKGELIDILFFLLSAFGTLGMTGEEIFLRYQAKYEINRQRAIDLGHIKEGDE